MSMPVQARLFTSKETIILDRLMKQYVETTAVPGSDIMSGSSREGRNIHEQIYPLMQRYAQDLADTIRVGRAWLKKSNRRRHGQVHQELAKAFVRFKSFLKDYFNNATNRDAFLKASFPVGDFKSAVIQRLRSGDALSALVIVALFEATYPQFPDVGMFVADELHAVGKKFGDDVVTHFFADEPSGLYRFRDYVDPKSRKYQPRVEPTGSMYRSPGYRAPSYGYGYGGYPGSPGRVTGGLLSALWWYDALSGYRYQRRQPIYPYR